VGPTWTRARLGAACALAVLSGIGMTGCGNLGKKAADAVMQPSQPTHHLPSGPTKRAARAFVHKTFVLYDQGHAPRACAFSESKPYLAVDRTCVSEAQKIVSQFHAHGLRAVSKTIAPHLRGTRGTVTVAWVINGHHVSAFSYLRYDGHRWWMTGSKKTGDRGL
jgi:hypothetical protein